jgi:uncharacterized membrane protein YqjE
VSGSTSGGSQRGLAGALAQFGAALLEIGRTRFELAVVEFDETRSRASEQFAMVLAAGICFAFALLAATVLIVVAFWETNRIAVLVGVTLTYLVLGLIALWRRSALKRASTPPFAATLAEFERDRAWLAERFGGDK